DLNIYLIRFVKNAERIGELRASITEIDRELARANADLERLSAERGDLQLSLDRLEQLSAEKRDDVQARIRAVESLEGEGKVLRERIQNGMRERARLEAQLESAQSGGGGVSERIEQITLELGDQCAALADSETALKTREEELRAAERALAAREQAAEDAKAEIIRAMNHLSDVKSQQARLGAMQSALEKQLGALAADAVKDDAGMRALNEHVADAEAKLTEEKHQLAAQQADMQDMLERVRVSTETSQRLTAALSQLRDKRQQIASRHKILREMQRDYEGLNNSVRQVLMQSRRLPDAGVRGVVADIIKVPERLERAIDMVLGAALQNIVVNRDEDAKRMIEYLRANRFGRATFLPLTSVRGRTLAPGERGALNLPGCVGLASELIEFDPEFQGVINNLLGRTVVAEDLDAGIAIQRAGRHQFRLVTLAGDVMHSGGSMTGGSVQSRATNLLSRSREIEQSAQAIKELDGKITSCTAELEESERVRAALKQARGEAYDAIHAQEVVCARAETFLQAALDERAGYMARSDKLKNERARLESQLEETVTSLARLDGRQDDAQQNTDDMQDSVRRMQEEIYGMRASVDVLRGDVSNERVSHATKARDYETKKRDLERLKTQSGDLDQLISDTVAQLDACVAELKGNEQSLERADGQLSAMKDALDSARAEYQGVETQRTGAQKGVQNLSKTIDELRETIDAQSAAKHKIEMQLQRVEGEHQQAQDRVWEEYELTYAGAEAFRAVDFKLTEAEKRVAQIRARIRQMGVVNVAAVDEYRQTAQRAEELSAQCDDLNGAIDDLLRIIAELERNMDRQFRAQFEIMNLNFKRTFTRLFGGGTAELRLSDPKDALNCGIDIVAQPPGKKLQTLSLLSGGERALTAIAILFAMLDVKPTPFCILDEIEAALDDANIDNFAEYLKTYSAQTQFVVITHRKGTMERCEALYGVVMEEKGVSKLVSVALNEAV
ncbi:MAG: chromosome segregation protein SMC, partial [Christensenellales bacterium]